MKEIVLKKNVMVGMSGGVDSSVAASILLDQGYGVTGVTLKLLENEDGDFAISESCEGFDSSAPQGSIPVEKTSKTCCSLDDVEDARATAFRLGIPFYVLNMKSEFKEKVIDYFIESYLDGMTPNPCLYCNKYLKFDAMLKKAKALEIDHIATGHYARREYDESTGKYLLKKALDPTKDQSYALYMLTQEQLSHLLLPLGSLSKSQIRAMAEQKELRVFNKPDSQDICFVSNGEYPEYIKRHTDKKIFPGLFVDRDGKKLGTHKGIIYYTVGQRKGLGIASKEPLFVIEKDVENNLIILGNKDSIKNMALTAKEMNYISIDEPTSAFRASAKVRYSSKEAPALITPLPGGRAKVEFDEAQAFIAPGQAVVIYDGDVVLGGGIIEK